MNMLPLHWMRKAHGHHGKHAQENSAIKSFFHFNNHVKFRMVTIVLTLNFTTGPNTEGIFRISGPSSVQDQLFRDILIQGTKHLRFCSRLSIVDVCLCFLCVCDFFLIIFVCFFG